MNETSPLQTINQEASQARIRPRSTQPWRDRTRKEVDMKSIAKTLGVAMLGAALAGTAALAQDVHVDFKNSAEMNRIHTYTFGNLHTTNPMLEPRLAIAIDCNLQLNGWKEGSDGDVLVTAVLASYDDPQLYEDFYANLRQPELELSRHRSAGELTAKRRPGPGWHVDHRYV
jgi:hypothetical protein